MNNKLIGVILAAGKGTRLGELTTKTPKALIRVADKPLIEYAINYLKKIGADQILVVGGYFYDQLKDSVERIDKNITVHFNSEYEKGNLYTLEKVIDSIDSDFFLMNADHIYHKDIALRVKSQLIDGIVAFTDNDRNLGDDDMKIFSSSCGNYLVKISKQLDDYHRGYVGKTFCSQNYIPIYKEALEEAKNIYQEKAVVENILQILADKDEHYVRLGDISGYSWHEVDYPHELEKADREIIKNINLYF